MKATNGTKTITAKTKALLMAAEESDEEIVRLLLDAGADVNAADHEGGTALMNAAWRGNYAMAVLLLERGANVNARTITLPGTGYYGGVTALSRAVGAGHLEVVRLLLEHGADINAQDDTGTTALMWAAQERHGDRLSAEVVFSIVQLLLERGADVNRATIHGMNCSYMQSIRATTALDLAMGRNNTDIVRLLERAGAKRGEMQDNPFFSTD